MPGEKTPSGLDRAAEREIRGTARDDARHRIPVPSPTDGRTFSTPWRSAVWSSRDADVAGLRGLLEEEATSCELEVQRILTELTDARTQAGQAREAYEKRERAGIDTGRVAGEERTPEKLVQQRRTREYHRDLGRLRLERIRTESALRVLVARQDELDVQMGRLRQKYAILAVQRHQQAVSERAVYDRELLRRHPARQKLQGLLDESVPPLPAWVTSQLELPPVLPEKLVADEPSDRPEDPEDPDGPGSGPAPGAGR